MKFQTIRKGKNMNILAFQQEQGSCPVEVFIDSLEKGEKIKLGVLFDKFDNLDGKLHNKEKVKKLSFSCKGCWEFKPSQQIRVSFIYLDLSQKGADKTQICLLDGFKKKSDKWPKQKIKITKERCKTVNKAQKQNEARTQRPQQRREAQTQASRKERI